MKKCLVQDRVRRSESEIRSLLKAQAEGGIKVNEFCKAHGLSRGIFYNWRNRYSESQKLPGFLPVQLPPADSSTAFAEIEFTAGQILRLFREVDSSYLKALVK
jgi:transposase-like protein